MGVKKVKQRLQRSKAWRLLFRKASVEATLYTNHCERSRLLDDKTFPVSILITNWNGEQEIETFLSSYAEHHSAQDAELVIIDHASRDASRERIRQWMTVLPIKLVCCDRNQRYSAANNLALIYAEGAVLIFANNDLTFDSPVIGALVAALDDPDVGLAGINLHYPTTDGTRSRKIQHQGIRFAADGILAFMRPFNVKAGPAAAHPYAEVAAVTAALAACRREDFEAVGGFLEDYDYGFEDVDLGLRFRRELNRKNVLCTGLAAIHTEFGSQRRQSKRTLQSRRHANALTFRNCHNRWLIRAVVRSQINGGFWHLKALRVRIPPTMAPDLSGLAPARGDVELLPMASGTADKHTGFCGIWLLDDPQELRSHPAPRGALTVARVKPGMAGSWQEVHLQHPLDLFLCDDAKDQLSLEQHGDAWLLETPAGAHSMAPGWLDWMLDTLLRHLDKPSIAIKVALPDLQESAQAELELAGVLGRQLREQGYRVRIDLPKHWADRRLFMDDVTITLRGDDCFKPEAGAVNLLWLIDADHPASDEELNGFEHVFTISHSEAAALDRRLSARVSLLERGTTTNPATTIDRIVRQYLPAPAREPLTPGA